MIYRTDSITGVCMTLYERGLCVGTQGNVSMRCEDKDFCYITPRGIHKGTEAFIPVKARIADGVWEEFNKQVYIEPSTEMLMHLAIYRKCPSVNAVIHAHPPHTIAVSFDFSTMILKLDETEEVRIAQYKKPASLELAEEVASLAENFSSIILEQHGAVTIGATIQEAFNRLEMLEHACRVNWLARAVK